MPPLTKMDLMDRDLQEIARASGYRQLKRKSTEEEANTSAYDSLKGMDADEVYNMVDEDNHTCFWHICDRKRKHREDPAKYPVGGIFYKELV